MLERTHYFDRPSTTKRSTRTRCTQCEPPPRVPMVTRLPLRTAQLGVFVCASVGATVCSNGFAIPTDPARPNAQPSHRRTLHAVRTASSRSNGDSVDASHCSSRAFSFTRRFATLLGGMMLEDVWNDCATVCSDAHTTPIDLAHPTAQPSHRRTLHAVRTASSRSNGDSVDASHCSTWGFRLRIVLRLCWGVCSWNTYGMSSGTDARTPYSPMM